MEPPGPRPGEHALRCFLLALLQTVHRETGVPGLAIAVRTPDCAISLSIGRTTARGASPLTLRGRFQIGCIAKLLTAIVVAQLVRERALDIEAPIEYYLTELSRRCSVKPIRVRHLLCHTSGYAGPGRSVRLRLADPAVALRDAWEQFVDFFRNTPQLFEPGTVFSYEHTEHVLLGEIVRRVSGDDIVCHYRERILEPFRLQAGVATRDPPEAFVAEHQYSPSPLHWAELEPLEHNAFWRASISDWTLSVTDLCRLACALLSGPDAPLESATATFLSAPVVALPVPSGGGIEWSTLPHSIGLGCSTYRGGILGHNGSVRGHACGMRVDPLHNTTVALGLSGYCPILRDWILERVLAYIRASTLPPDERMPAEERGAVAIEPSSLIGRYVGPQDAYVIVSREGARLVAEIFETDGGSPCARISFEVDDHNRLVRSKECRANLAGFFRDERTYETVLMVGMTAFRMEPV